MDEQLGYSLTGEGEHLFLRIEKQNLNTEELVKHLAKALNKPTKLISYAGLKDRQAITTQWLSVHCPGEEIENASTLKGDGWRVLQSTRHLKKLKTGGLLNNQFTIVLRGVEPCETLKNRLQQITSFGVPNYFGPQRFGHQGQNLIRAEKMLIEGQRVKDKFLRGIYYSAVRSYLFNRILSLRITENNWNLPLAGDVLQLNGSHSIFSVETPDETIFSRIIQHDLSPASVLYGKGKELVSLEALEIQQKALAGMEGLCEALISHGLERTYRAHILQVNNFEWTHEKDILTLSFSLPPGAYATSVLRELVQF